MTNNTTVSSHQTNEVGYYNKEIIKKKQRDNKDIAKEQWVASPSSFGLASLSGPSSLPIEVALGVTPSGREGQEREALPQVEPSLEQAPTSPPDFITEQHIKRAVVQFYHNQGQEKKQERKLKIRLNCDFGSGKEENVDFIATLTTDLSNFKAYHPPESREFIHSWTMDSRKQIKDKFGVKPYMGKFHDNAGWQAGKARTNQIEPWSACLLWYNKDTRSYWCLIRVYCWEAIFELTDEHINDNQRKTNLKAQKLWYNPIHLNIVRPKTWAQKRGLAK